jgi:LemA protein
VSERYPELKASEIYQSTMASMNEYEEKVRKSRMVYNDSVTKMNRMVRQFPSSLVAALLHFGLREYLEVEDKKKDYPQI